MTPTRALIEAAEEAKQILNDAGNSSFSDSIIESINILEAAISSAKAAEEGVEGSDLFCKTPVWLIRRIRELETQLAKEKAPEGT